MSVVSFEPFSSLLHSSFWHRLTQLKLDIFQLDEAPIDISGCYNVDGTKGVPPQFRFDYSSFHKLENQTRFAFNCFGKLINTNTRETFQSLCSKETLYNAFLEVSKAIEDKQAINDTTKLVSFVLLCHGDLKRYQFYYWAAFPVIVPRKPYVFVEQPQSIKLKWNQSSVAKFETGLSELLGVLATAPFFAYNMQTGHFLNLSEVYSSIEHDKYAFCFGDSSSNESFGWPLRNYLLLLQRHFSFEKGAVTLISLRRTKDANHVFTFHQSLVFTVAIEKLNSVDINDVAISGWERQRKTGKLAPYFVDMSRSMDPVKLADEAVSLNLKLMKWRVAPELNLDIISATKCVLLGCGTLGCNVARNLLSWGVRKFSLVDNGKISYSNPVRQSLFTFEHCIDSSTLKADVAAKSLKLIYPGIEVNSFPELSIPMPGHPISNATVDISRRNWEQLDQLIKECDVVFLLTDSRESRWLPAVLAATYGKLAITSALGFDSYLVMRHGSLSSPVSSRLGCYFCTDVVGPTNSLRDRTLDQQCTVSRGGISMITSGLAVELMVSVLNHPERITAPANSNDACLGIVPHQIRGFLSKYEQITVNSPAFDNCSACSQSVVDAYRKEGFDFVKKVCANPSHLEEVSGLAELQRQSAKLTLEDFCVSDDDF